jgi:assimilatory nitrate reductase catalytic subunit
VLLIAGANCAETFPVLNKFLWQQRDNGGRWIIVAPRETPTARQGDLHLQLKPGTDVALANGMLNVIIGENLVDEAFIAARTNDWEATKEVAARYTPQLASEITGVPAEKIVQAPFDFDERARRLPVSLRQPDEAHRLPRRTVP